MCIGIFTPKKRVGVDPVAQGETAGLNGLSGFFGFGCSFINAANVICKEVMLHVIFFLAFPNWAFNVELCQGSKIFFVFAIRQRKVYELIVEFMLVTEPSQMP